MISILPKHPVIWPQLAWLCVAITGAAAPAATLIALAKAAPPAAEGRMLDAILAVGLMGAGMIGAAVAGSWRWGIGLALTSGLGLVLLACALALTAFGQPEAVSLAAIIAAASFAARGALFARSGADKGWWIAVFVVSGEVAILATALAMPGALPDGLLALLPAQWAATALGMALSGGGILAAGAPLFALAATATATLLVARLLPRRWPYLIMFTTWLACSALVWFGSTAAPS